MNHQMLLGLKSAMFHCEIEISEWSDYGESFAHYKDGQQLEYMEGNLDPDMLEELGIDIDPDEIEESQTSHIKPLAETRRRKV